MGPVVAGQIVDKLGFVALNMTVAILSLLYCPMLYYLKDMHDYKAYESEEEGPGPGVVMKDPPAKEFQTIALQVKVTFKIQRIFSILFYGQKSECKLHLFICPSSELSWVSNLRLIIDFFFLFLKQGEVDGHP